MRDERLEEVEMTTETDALERATMTIPEAAVYLGVSRNSAYKAAREGSIPSVRVGNRLIVPKAALEKLLADA